MSPRIFVLANGSSMSLRQGRPGKEQTVEGRSILEHPNGGDQ